MTLHNHAFQAEVKQLLHLVTHSLYSNKEIFLRELISNASDACDKLRFMALDDATLWENASELEVRVSFDKAARTLTISDNGIGMSEQDAIEHLGTIAKSGTREFLSRLAQDKKPSAQMIGQFGVGFYSAFVVADKVTVESRRAGLPQEQGMRWVSEGAGEFSVEAVKREQRGTAVTLHLREGEDEWLSTWRLKEIIRKYSDHISLPVKMRKEEWDKDKQETVTKDEWESANQSNALWTRPKQDIEEAHYHEFYKQLSYDSEAPLAYTHNRVEGATEYTQLLYIPAKAPFDLWNREKRGGLKLYVQRVFIMDDAEALLPIYLRFVKGVVDSNDLPLNVSRELLQESKDVKYIRDGCTKRVLGLLEDLAKDKAESYAKFWGEFGQVLKEGVGEDFSNRDRIAKLLRFASTQSGTAEQNVALADYVARMKEGQDAIYYLVADSYNAAKASPQIELFRKKGVEVLLLWDRVDEWMLSMWNEFEGKPLKSVASTDIDLGKLQDDTEKKQDEARKEQSKPLIEKLKDTLKGEVSDVRVSSRLVDSAACLVTDTGDMSPHLKRLLKQVGQQAPDSKPVLEINPDHNLVTRLQRELLAGPSGHTTFTDLAHVLLDQARLSDGGTLEDPQGFLQRLNRLLG